MIKLVFLPLLLIPLFIVVQISCSDYLNRVMDVGTDYMVEVDCDVCYGTGWEGVWIPRSESDKYTGYILRGDDPVFATLEKDKCQHCEGRGYHEVPAKEWSPK